MIQELVSRRVEVVSPSKLVITSKLFNLITIRTKEYDTEKKSNITFKARTYQ